MADTLPLPQYSLPTQGLPQGLDVASATPPNALSQVGPGITAGASMGFVARQTAALEQERQTQLMQAQAAAQQARKANNIAALQAVGEQYDRVAKIHPDAAFDLYKSQLAPLMSAVVSDTGLQADFHTDANPSHETADNVKIMRDAVSGLADGTIQMPTFQKIMIGVQSKNNISEYARQRADEAQKSGIAIQDYQRNQQTQIQQGSDDFSKAADTAIKAQNAAIEGKRLLASGNPIGEDVVATIAPQAADVQARMSPAVMNRYGGSKAIGARIAESIQQAQTGQFSKGNRDLFAQVLDIMDKSSSYIIDKAVGSTATKYSSRVGIPTHQLIPQIAGQYGQTYIQKRQAAIQWAQQNPNNPLSSKVLNKAKSELGAQ
jgi:hypothetical protein